MLEKLTIVEEKQVYEKSEHKPVQLSFFRLVYLEINPILSVNPVNKPVYSVIKLVYTVDKPDLFTGLTDKIGFISR